MARREHSSTRKSGSVAALQPVSEKRPLSERSGEGVNRRGAALTCMSHFHGDVLKQQLFAQPLDKRMVHCCRLLHVRRGANVRQLARNAHGWAACHADGDVHKPAVEAVEGAC
jgi:hypothetical protein